MADVPYKLSLLDKSPIADDGDAYQAIQTSLAYAQAADKLGFNRIWYAEHHGSPTLASTAPEIFAAFILARTQRIRVGSGGVLLQHYSPYKVAESFRLLSALAPGRVDIGIGKSPGGMPLDTRAIQSEIARDALRPFEEKLEELDAFLGNGPRDDHRLAGAQAKPDIGSQPDRFLLGASAASAQLAARLGWGFCHAGHHNADPSSLRESQLAFGRPLTLAVNAHVAPTQSAANALVSKLSVFKVIFEDGHAVNLPSEAAAREYARQYGHDEFRLEEKQPHVFAGTAVSVKAELDRLHREFGIREFIIDNPVASAQARIQSIQLLAGAYAPFAAAG